MTGSWGLVSDGFQSDVCSVPLSTTTKNTACVIPPSPQRRASTPKLNTVSFLLPVSKGSRDLWARTTPHHHVPRRQVQGYRGDRGQGCKHPTLSAVTSASWERGVYSPGGGETPTASRAVEQLFPQYVQLKISTNDASVSSCLCSPRQAVCSSVLGDVLLRWVAVRRGSQAINQKVAGSIPGTIVPAKSCAK